MRTLGHCQEHGLTLYTGCRCGWSRKRPAQAECRAMRAFTIEELQRMGWFACGDCGGRDIGVSIYSDGLGYPMQLEGWIHRAPGFARPLTLAGV
ncbi:hypothetical protein OVA11_14310 [Caulobacter sp. SL161]|uniref:hypothetical protein n=1 Tax=Caulobacter sp. SL161 TaxID=2995156 RepID=UPI002274464B|nr:hypothetical protein [Caulobacter sp. SL161]MCY1648194.1 hypothetical protein [Caulobacter sp. SL161]